MLYFIPTICLDSRFERKRFCSNRIGEKKKKNLKFRTLNFFFFFHPTFPATIYRGNERRGDRHGRSMFQRSLKLMTRDTMSTWRQEEGGGDETLGKTGEERTGEPRFLFTGWSVQFVTSSPERRNGKKDTRHESTILSQRLIEYK